ncbi:hypothetical protein FGO68_gene3995 [Halteria grandinella]|uniref:Uncharacterized protein n=1 Tax=Halteria grandinella TaxID=5974 RepID=A0A8J8P3R6_HALGN|nr:hypothetical protein FGO68_gene3995 [Halteria grandinella]
MTIHSYFSRRLRRLSLLICSTGCSFNFTIFLLSLTSSSASLLRTFIVVWIIILSVSLLIKKRNYQAVLQQIAEVNVDELEPVKDAKLIQQAVQVLWEQIEASERDQSRQRVINQMIIRHEEDMQSEDVLSYMEVISLLAAGGLEVLENELPDAQDQDKAYESASQSFYLSMQHHSLANLNLNSDRQRQTQNENSEMQEESLTSIREHRTLRKLQTNGSENKGTFNQSCKRFNTDIENGISGGTIERKSLQLNDVFVKNTITKNHNAFLNQKRGQDYEGKGLISHVVKLLNQTADGEITQSEAIKLVKVRYLYDMLQGKWARRFPKNTTLMFFRAYLGIEYLQNKYLALTSIAGINQLSNKKGYIEQLQDLISEGYFVGKCEVKDENLGEMHVEIGEYLNESLQVDKIIHQLAKCSDFIGQFWAFYGQDELGPQQFTVFSWLSNRIPRLLSEIRRISHSLERASSANQVYKSDLLYISISHFYTIVLRDSALGSKVLSKYESIIGIKNSGEGGPQFQKTAFNEDGQEEIGVMVVDGKFDLYGKVIFGNKYIIQALGYKSVKELASMTIHRIMPRCVAEVHNLFWKGFQSVGEPKVLDKLRYLFVKDAENCITPFKCFIKFQYTPQFGYCFIGLFSKPQNIMFHSTEVPLDLEDTCQLICNKQGQILDCSPSANSILRLTPTIIEGLQAQLTEGLNLSILNPHSLHLKEIDFDSANCIHFKQIKLNMQPLYKFIDYFEQNDERGNYNSNESSPLFSSISSSIQSSYQAYERAQTQKMGGPNPFNTNVAFESGNSDESEDILKVQMKIIRECYDLGSQYAPLELYYVLITEQVYYQTNDLASQFEEKRQTLMHSNSLNEGPQTERQLAFQRDNIYGEYANFMQGTFGNNNQFKNSRDDSLRQVEIPSQGRDMASQYSASMQQDNSVRVMDEGIEEQRLPKALNFLRFALSILLSALLILSVTQYLVNQSQLETIRKLEKIMISCKQNEEYITQINLMTRSYLNIMKNLERDSSSLVNDSSLHIREEAFQLIDKIRVNVNELQVYFNQANVIKAKIFNLLPNMTVENRDVLRFYGVNLWLVRLEELYSYTIINSTVGTFEGRDIKRASVFDILVFITQYNGRLTILEVFENLIQDEQSLIESSMNKGVLQNNTFLLLSAVLTLLGLLISLKQLHTLLSFKHIIFTLFNSAMSSPQIDLHQKGAKSFQTYVETGSESMLVEQQQRVNVYKQAIGTYKNGLGESSALKRAKSMYIGPQVPEEQAVQKKAAAAIVIEKKPQAGGEIGRRKSMLKRQSLFVREEHFLGLVPPPNVMQTKAQQQLIELRKLYGGVNNAPVKEEPKKQDSEPMRFTQKDEEEDQDTSPRHNEPSHSSAPDAPKEFHLIQQLSLNKARLQWRLAPLVIALAAVFVVYFLVQQLLFVRLQELVKVDSEQMISMIESSRCLEGMIDGVRQIQVANNTEYDISFGILKVVQSNKGKYFNQTFQNCLQITKQVQTWLQTSLNSRYYITPASQSLDGSMCAQQSSTTLPYDVCTHIYKGVFQQGILQATSLFLKDVMYSYLRFINSQAGITRHDLIQDYLNAPQMLDMLDAEFFFLSPFLRHHYQLVIDEVLGEQVNALANKATLIAFSLFLAVIIIMYLFLEFSMLSKGKKWFWRVFMLVQLLPRDDMDKEMVKKINELVANN